MSLNAQICLKTVFVAFAHYDTLKNTPKANIAICP